MINEKYAEGNSYSAEVYQGSMAINHSIDSLPDTWLW